MVWAAALIAVAEASIVAMVTTTLTGIIAPVLLLWLGRRLRQETTDQHAAGRQLQQMVLDSLDSLDGRVEKLDVRGERIEAKVDGAIEWQRRHELFHRAVA